MKLNCAAYGPEVDTWSLGVVLFELITGFRPIDGATEEDIEDAIHAVNFRFPAFVPETIRNLIRQVLPSSFPCLTEAALSRLAGRCWSAPDAGLGPDEAPEAGGGDGAPVGGVPRDGGDGGTLLRRVAPSPLHPTDDDGIQMMGTFNDKGLLGNNVAGWVFHTHATNPEIQ